MSSFRKRLKDLIDDSDLTDYRKEEKFAKRKKARKNKGKDKRKWREKRREKRGYDKR
jgi:hypothetical protein